mmetsp:Transcript_4590/g.12773  ORF Transcript_4590/g.12773 Transcript_4590/m.12773 type:complete len:410 (-) Transcript_4590:101-1330(-)
MQRTASSSFAGPPGTAFSASADMPEQQYEPLPRQLSVRSNSSAFLPSFVPRTMRPDLMLVLVVIVLWSTTVVYLGRKPCMLEPVHVRYTHHFTGAPSNSGNTGKRPKITAFIGVQTGYTEIWGVNSGQYEYEKRRMVLRSTWFPEDEAAMHRMYSDYGIVMRFVIGHTTNTSAAAALDKEIQQFGPMLRLNLLEGYTALSYKSHAYFATVMSLYNPAFVVKIDDDTYFRPDRLYHSLAGYRKYKFGYIGCMKTGPVVTNSSHRWFEPEHAMIGGSYFAHAWGPAYILSGGAAGIIAKQEPESLRHFMNEDVTVGGWMMLFNVRFFDDRRLCEPPNCSDSTIVSYELPLCAGICNPLANMTRWHTRCGPAASPATPPGKHFVPMEPPLLRLNHEVLPGEGNKSKAEQESA